MCCLKQDLLEHMLQIGDGFSDMQVYNNFYRDNNYSFHEVEQNIKYCFWFCKVKKK